MSIKLLLIGLMVILFCSPVSALWYFWTGNIDSDWSNPANWHTNNGTLPGDGDSPRIAVRTDELPITNWPVYNYDNRQSAGGPGAATGFFIIAEAAPGTFTMAGGYLLHASRLNIGNGGSSLGQWIHQGGTFDGQSNTVFVGNNSAGLLRIADGLIKAASLNIGNGNTPGQSASVELYGGLIDVADVQIGQNGNIIFDGGILRWVGEHSVIEGMNTAEPRNSVIVDFDGTATVFYADPDFDSNQAWNPYPANGAGYVYYDVVLSWDTGDDCEHSLIYFGTDETAVSGDSRFTGDITADGKVNVLDLNVMADNWLGASAEAEPNPDLTGDSFVGFTDFSLLAGDWLKQNTLTSRRPVGMNTFSPGPLEAGKTYYWRVDQECSGGVTKGKVWSFTVDPFDPRLASEPSPSDFGEGIGYQNITLSWTEGENALWHDVYLSASINEVENAHCGMSQGGVYKGVEYDADYYAGDLQEGQSYYWRIDTWDGENLHTGRIWSFTAVTYGLDFGIKPPQHLYAIPFNGMDLNVLTTISSLQGIVAQTRPQLCFYHTATDHSYYRWLEEFTEYGIEIIYADSVRGGEDYLEWALGHFSDHINGYILYDSAVNEDSLNIASSLAGILKAIPVDVSLESRVQSRGLTKVIDVRTQTYYWLYNNYASQMNRRMIISRDPDPSQWPSARLHDLTSSARSMLLWADTSFTDFVYNDLENNSPIFGWSHKEVDNEVAFVDYNSGFNLYTVPSGGLLNLSAYMGMAALEPRIDFQQNARVESFTPETGVHYVTFIMSDLDNITIALQGWSNDTGRWASPYRGDFAMAWGMAPNLFKLAPHVAKWWYNTATEKDNFIVPFSGMGYLHPSKMPAVDKFIEQTDRYMLEGDLRAIWFKDYPSFYSNSSLRAKLGAMNSPRGFFVSGEPYNNYGKRIEWTGGKPFISTRDQMWEGFESPSSICSKINNRSTNVTSDDAYSAVVIHAWSYDMNDVKWVVDNLNSNVRVVTPEEMIERIYINQVNR